MSVPQHEIARAAANRVRKERYELRAEVAALNYSDGLTRVAELLESPPDYLGTLRVADLLQLIHRVKKHGSQRILRGAQEASISERCTVGKATQRQREALARYLRGEREQESPWAA